MKPTGLPPLADARTTPPALRLPALALLAGTALYFLVCYRFSLAYLGVAEPPAGVAGAADWFWLGRWRMFTELRDTHTDLDARVLVGGAWQAVDLAVHYPSHWDEGPGYLRDDFYGRPDRLARLARDLCVRVRPDAARVSFTLVTWPRVLGASDPVRTDATESLLYDEPCRGGGGMPPGAPGASGSSNAPGAPGLPGASGSSNAPGAPGLPGARPPG